ncbi:DNA mismatch repair protein MutT, partial [Paenibacillus sp. J5C_2022]|nr:DNA mismatch repair protein MutT [Paenibacillus sp. J5C2022]
MSYVEEIRALVGHRPIILVGAIVIVINKQGH